MKRVILVTMAVLALAMGGCTGDKGKELFETAQFEEKQHNMEHAERLYEEIVSKYPGSDYAGKARERLAELKKGK